MPKVLILADLGQENYHVGDEAMGIAAQVALEERGFETYIATRSTDHSRAYIRSAQGYIETLVFPGEPARREEYLEEVRACLSGARVAREISEFIHHVSAMDGILIAGGGNMNSVFGWLLYERAAYALVAEHFGIPLVISGQSIGPVLTDRDERTLAELLSVAQLVGMREQTSFDRVRALGIDVRHCVDDATFYSVGQRNLPHAPDFTLPSDYICATFTNLSDSEVQTIAVLLDDIYRRYGFTTVLVQHKGMPGEALDDIIVARRIAEWMTSPCLVLPILHADSTVAIHQGAHLNFSNRYHPGVFSLAAGVPYVALIPDAFTDIRIAGLMAHYGVEGFAVSQELIAEVAGQALTEAIERREDITAHLQSRSRELAIFSISWWDAVASELRGQRASVGLMDLGPAPTFEVGDWSEQNTARRAKVAQVSLSETLAHAHHDRERSWADYRAAHPTARVPGQPLVSVIIPAYNAAHTIGDQLECLSRQKSAPNFEVIISDNGSTDELVTAVEPYRNRLNVRIVDSSQIQGVSHARNVGIQESQCDFIMICDADDFVSQGWVRAMYDAMCTYPDAYVLGQYLYISDEGGLRLQHPEVQRLFTEPKWQDVFIQDPDPSAPIETHFFIGGGSLAFRREAGLQLRGFDSSYTRGGDDWDFFARARLAGMRQVEAYGAAIAYRISHSPAQQLKRQRFYGLNDVLVTSRFPAQVQTDTSVIKQMPVLLKTPYRLARYRDLETRVKIFSDLGYALGIIQGTILYRALRRIPRPVLMKENQP
ncbi:glycosyltransferase [Rothia sp. LK2492]|uniref:glycosyltransferase n=1 Tax=Rothia sp. LK2492 TaxID=3114370 RepID=UPI0034CF91B1